MSGSALFRIMLMFFVMLSAIVLTTAGGEVERGSLLGFLEVLILGTSFLSLPIFLIISLLHFVETAFPGQYARNTIASIGIIPLLLLPFFGNLNNSFASFAVFPGLVWYGSWLITSAVFVKRAPRG